MWKWGKNPDVGLRGTVDLMVQRAHQFKMRPEIPERCKNPGERAGFAA